MKTMKIMGAAAIVALTGGALRPERELQMRQGCLQMHHRMRLHQRIVQMRRLRWKLRMEL